MFVPRAHESFHIVRARPIAVVLSLVVLAAVGFAVVRELTKPEPLRPVPSIEVGPGSPAQAAPNRRTSGEARERRGGFDPPPTSLPAPAGGGAADDDDGGEE
jgi:hypothetical protein